MKNLFWLVLLFMCHNILCYLNIDELKSVNYGIYIDDQPVVLSEELPIGAVTLSSKYGQLYQCSYPDVLATSSSEENIKKVALEKGIAELLQPMKKGPCLLHTNGWWTYEFCYGKQIKQYHLDERQVPVADMSLGIYSSDVQWNDKLYKERRRRRHHLYHSQQYVNGTLCALTNRPRNVEVRFFCEDGHSDYIVRVDEPATCSYVITVHTMKICDHPYMHTPRALRPTQITCNPLLERAQYDEYLQQVKEQNEADLEMMADHSQIPSYGSPEEEPPRKKTFVEDKETAEQQLAVEPGDDDDDDDAMVNEFITSLGDVGNSAVMKAYLAQYKANIQKTVRAEFREIMKQAEAEMQHRGANSQEDKLAALQEMANSMRALLAHKDAENAEHSDGTDDDDDADAVGSKGEVSETEVKKEIPLNEDTGSEEAGRRKVRVIKVNEVKRHDEEEEEEEDDEEDGMHSGKTRKFEVKIVTAGYYDEKEGRFHMLGDDDNNAAFKDMIVTILGGNDKAQEETTRHEDMEQKYQRVWGQSSQRESEGNKQKSSKVLNSK